MNIAAKVAQEKAAHPENFCSHKGCLWRTETSRGPNPCQKHPVENDARILQLIADLQAHICQKPSCDLGERIMEAILREREPAPKALPVS